MKQLDLKLSTEQKDYDSKIDQESVLRTAVHVYERIGLIHPFGDANGRVARLSMNHLMRRYGLGYVVLPPLGESKELWEALQEGHRGMLDALVKCSSNCLLR